MLASRTAALVTARGTSRRPAGQRRTIVDWMTNYPDKIAEIKKVQVANGTWNRPGHDPVAHPTWIKQPGDWATLGFGGLLVGYGLITCVIGHYRLATGKGKIDA